MFDLFDYMPEAASEWAERVDWINNFITSVSVFCILSITAVMVIFAIKYRRTSDNQETAYITHNGALETVWTVIPSVVSIFVFYYGFTVYRDMRTAPASAIEITVQAFQWGWNFQYSTGKTSSSDVVVPVNQPVRFVMRSKDVNHSFFIPAMRVKEDVLGSMYTFIWFTPTKLGEYPIFCAEYCGLSHFNMRATLRVVSMEEYNDFINDRREKELTPAEMGAAKFTEKACNSCHSLDGSPLVGPTLKGIFNREEELADGTKITVDENYLRESILNPQAKIVKGFAPAMPAFEGQLSEDELQNLITYLKTL